MFGVDRRQRAALVEERITLLQRLWAGEHVNIEGRSVRVTPLPFTPGGPPLAYGGGTEAAARRAARLGLLFIAETHDATLEEAYRAEGGATAPGCFFPQAGVPITVFVSDDPERAWAEIGQYLFQDSASYAQWNAHREGTASISRAASVQEKGRTRSSLPPRPAAWSTEECRSGCSPWWAACRRTWPGPTSRRPLRRWRRRVPSCS
jgi:alkanesulfonate monooxygenase SsuD/methylene tetrahydromethanopterin reductase-like flavin-dependent oxidoreductase (luciferase family)